jgi:hypothetical protein
MTVRAPWGAAAREHRIGLIEIVVMLGLSHARGDLNAQRSGP